MLGNALLLMGVLVALWGIDPRAGLAMSGFAVVGMSARRAATFTVRDFALSVFHLEYLSETVAFVGEVMARYKQSGVSIQRMLGLMQGAGPGAPVAHGLVYVRGAAARGALPARPTLTASSG